MSKGGALVTGGLSGMGLVLTREMAAQGHSPVITASRTGMSSMPVDALQHLDVIQELTAHHDIRCDLSDASAVSDVLARYQGSVGPVRSSKRQTGGRPVILLRLGGATGSAYGDLDAIEVYTRVLERLRRLSSKEPKEELSEASVRQWESVKDSLGRALTTFKEATESQPYTQEQHRVRLTLEDMEDEMGHLISKLRATASST
eukprot:TRINITY_DN11637_c0_g1_i1.p1 TRINITY_DN11637_c0_g1~~TRINITY_DN11637_c0_g1_i1.p1  ORF type:complete len:203 (-),score=30.46 TRINITY_DN11637_c0_g1_i1:83-691(-)